MIFQAFLVSAGSFANGQISLPLVAFAVSSHNFFNLTLGFGIPPPPPSILPSCWVWVYELLHCRPATQKRTTRRKTDSGAVGVISKANSKKVRLKIPGAQCPDLFVADIFGANGWATNLVSGKVSCGIFLPNICNLHSKKKMIATLSKIDCLLA